MLKIFLLKYGKYLDLSELKVGINFYFKMLAIIVNFLIVPLMLKYLDTEEYGLWILISSLVNWIYSFDIGIGNGLKNKIAEYLVENEIKKIREIISTSYLILSIVSLIIYGLSVMILQYIDINKLLNIYFIDRINLLNLIKINIGLVCINFVLSICNNIFIGFQKAYLVYLNSFISQLLLLIILIVLLKYEKKSIFYLSIIYGGTVSISHILLSIIFFKRKLKNVFIRIVFSKKEIKNLLSIGGKIFFIQLAGLIIFSTDNIMISYFLGTDEIGEYSIVNRYFSVSLILLNLILTPLWTKATKEYYSKNYNWFILNLKKMKILFIILCIIIFFQIVFGQLIIKIWTVGKIKTTIIFLLLNGLTVLVLEYSNIYSTFLSGINKIDELMYIAIFQAILNIVLSYIFLKYLNLGINGVILATYFCMMTNIFSLPKILKKKLEEI